MLAWFCFHCSWGAKIETWDTAIGKRWLCKNCGVGGRFCDEDSPRYITEDSQGDEESDTDFSERLLNEVGQAESD